MPPTPAFYPRATTWRLRTRSLELEPRSLLMGIVNVTPDSFSDGGKFFSSQAAIEHGIALAEAGANLLDIGGESTRPYSDPVSLKEELSRVMPVVEGLCRETDLPISIDTSKAIVAKQAIEAGAEIINDVTGLEGDPKMVEVALRSQAGICAMHMQGTPQTMQEKPTYGDIVQEIFSYLEQRRTSLLSVGIESERICLDPGIGFGKSHQHNLTLLAHCWEFHRLNCPILVGPSRKGFIGKVLGDSQQERTFGTVGVALALAQQGIQVLRVHDVRAIAEALLLFEASGGLAQHEARQPPADDVATN